MSSLSLSNMKNYHQIFFNFFCNKQHIEHFICITANSVYMMEAPPPYPGIDPNMPQQANAYPPQANGYPPQDSAYPPQANGYPPQADGYPPPNSGYPPQANGYPPQNIGYPPQANGYPPQPGKII